MRYSASEKLEIIRIVTNSDLGIKRTLSKLGVNRSTFYKWLGAYLKCGDDAFLPQTRTSHQWNRIPDAQRGLVIELALEHPELSARELATFLEDNFRMKQVHGAPHHPQTQGKIERYHRSMKNTVKLQNYYHPSELEEAIAQWVDYYNNKRYHESLDNLTPASVYFGQAEAILNERNRLKERTLQERKINYISTNTSKTTRDQKWGDIADKQQIAVRQKKKQ